MAICLSVYVTVILFQRIIELMGLTDQLCHLRSRNYETIILCGCSPTNLPARAAAEFGCGGIQGQHAQKASADEERVALALQQSGRRLALALTAGV